MHRDHQRRTPAVLAVLLVLLALGCSASPTATQLPPPPPPASLECETGAFPCTFDDIADDVRAETERLAAEATARITEGATNDELVAWLDSEERVAEVEGDLDAVRFRPVGGRGVWVVRPDSASEPTSRGSQAVAHAGTWDAGGPRGETSQTVTGEGRTERRALVLSPFRWDFGESDDGQAVAEQLRQLPDYAAGVTYAENATVNSTDVSVDDFRGWDGLQVVHLVSHGFRLCKDGKCRAVVAANALPGATANIWGSAVRGLELEVVAGPDSSLRPKYHTLLGADFFRDQYPSGLDDTVVFLNGCATFGPGATDLADAIRGFRSVVLGWSRSVLSDAAQAASVAMYDQLAGNGRTVGAALELLGGLATSEHQTATGQSIVSTLTSTGRALGGDLRIRDVVDFQDPAGTGPLADGTAVHMIGVPDDGAPDSVGWQLRVDGIEAEAASAIVSVTIDGHAAPPTAVSTGTMDGNDSWRLSGTLNLGVDVSVPHDAQFEASLELPEGGQSLDVVPAVLVGESEPTPAAPAMGTVWRGHVTDRFEVSPGVWIVAEADLIFTFDPGSNPNFLHFALTGGTMTYSVNGTYSDGSCTQAGSAGQIVITPEIAATQGFYIRNATSAPTFEGSVHVEGPIFEVMKTCYGEYAYLTGPYSTRAQGIFIHVFSDEARPVVNYRISGTSLYGDRNFDISRSE